MRFRAYQVEPGETNRGGEEGGEQDPELRPLDEVGAIGKRQLTDKERHREADTA